MASVGRPRRQRPKESQFVGTTLADKWGARAARKEPGFAWDGSGYMSSRTQALDETSMLPYAEVLKILLEVAPSGFPAQRCLKDAFEELDKRHGILMCDARFVQRAASLAADAWRIMTKHLYNAAQAEKVMVNKELQQLVKKIKLPSAEDDGGAALASGGSFDDSPSAAAAVGPEEGAAADMSASAVKALFPPSMGGAAEGDDIPEAENTEVELSDSDVELCGMMCNCLACREARTVDLTGSGSPTPIPNAELGGQKRETRIAQTALKGKGNEKDNSMSKGKSKSKSQNNGKGKGKGKSNGKAKGKGKGKGKLKTKSQADEGKDKPEGTNTRTKYTVRMRLMGKVRPSDAASLKPPKKAKGPPKQEEKAEIDGGGITLPATVTVREPTGTRRGEAYLLDGNKKYIMGITSRRTVEYKDVVERAAEKINGTVLKTKDDLKIWFDQQIGFDTS